MSLLERGAAERLHAQERRWLDDARNRLRALPTPVRRRATAPRPTPEEER